MVSNHDSSWTPDHRDRAGRRVNKLTAAVVSSALIGSVAIGVTLGGADTASSGSVPVPVKATQKQSAPKTSSGSSSSNSSGSSTKSYSGGSSNGGFQAGAPAGGTHAKSGQS